jgi:hypothetical protein
MAIIQVFKVQFDGDKAFQQKTFMSWREAFRAGKKANKKFSIFMRDYEVASWCPTKGFYAFIDPDFILQAELSAKRRQEKNKKIN